MQSKMAIWMLVTLVLFFGWRPVNANTSNRGVLEICHKVASAVNDGSFEQTVLKGQPLDSDSIPTPQEIHPQEIQFKDKIDITGNGKAKFVFITYDGLSIYDDNLSRLPIELDPEADWDTRHLRGTVTLSMLEYKGHFYIAVKEGRGHLIYLAKITSGLTQKMVCEFDQQKRSAIKLLKATDSKVCHAVEKGQISYSLFDQTHTLSAASLNNAGWHNAVPGELAALVDIDNAGQPRYVVQTRPSSPTAECQDSGLAILQEDRSQISRTPASALLKGVKGSCSGSQIKPFSFSDQIYLEHKDDLGKYGNTFSVYQIKGGNLETVCEYEIRPVNYVLDEYQSLLRQAHYLRQDPWELALASKSLDKAKLLLLKGHSIEHVVSGQMTLLQWAIWQQRDDLVEFLLSNGANTNAKSDWMSPLEEALWRGSGTAVILRLLSAGADPSKALHRVTEFADSNPGGRAVFKAVIERLGFIPLELISHAVTKDETMLEVFLATRLPIQVKGKSWEAGKRERIPYWIRTRAGSHKHKDTQNRLVQLFNRQVMLPTHHEFEMSYRSAERNWVFIRWPGSNVSEEDFIRFTTSFCSSFLLADCGTDDLVRESRAWADALPHQCPKQLANHLDATGCRVLVHFSIIGSGKISSVVELYKSVPENSNLYPASSIEELIKLYRTNTPQRRPQLQPHN